MPENQITILLWNIKSKSVIYEVLFRRESMVLVNILKKVMKHFLNRNETVPLKKSNVQEFIENGGLLGSDCEIHSTVFFGSEPYLITIGNKVRITDGVRFLTHDGGLWVLRNLKSDMKDADYFARIKIEDNVHIGWNSIIMPGVTIGENSIIGCGAIVTKSIPKNSVAVGIPARVIESIDEYYEKKKDSCVMTKHFSSEEKKLALLNEYGY